MWATHFSSQLVLADLFNWADRGAMSQMPIILHGISLSCSVDWHARYATYTKIITIERADWIVIIILSSVWIISKCISRWCLSGATSQQCWHGLMWCHHYDRRQPQERPLENTTFAEGQGAGMGRTTKHGIGQITCHCFCPCRTQVSVASPSFS